MKKSFPPSKNSSIIVYSAQWCSDCQLLKRFLDKHKVSYELRDIQENPAFRQELIKNAGELAVPFAVINGKWVRAYPDGEGYSEPYARELFGITG